MAPRTSRPSILKATMPPEAEADSAADVGMERDDYSSVTISVDHLTTDARGDGHTVTKFVFSTESAQESLLSQLDYFKQNALLRDSGVIAMVHRLGQEAGAAVYAVRPELTNIIVDMKVFTDTMQHPTLGGTVMNTVASFLALAADLRASANKGGYCSPLLLYIPD